ncbi:hypothetical protein BU15DRAFT_24064, partial [Melanogaster broomeanus]
LVIDALDECKDCATWSTSWNASTKREDCRLFATSRPLPDIPTAFSGLPTIDLNDMDDETQHDMKLHVEKEVFKRPKLLPYRDEIVLSLLQKADGMFRWVQCQLDRLSSCRTNHDINKVLDTLPNGLYETYDRILSDVNEKEFDGWIAKNTLLWLIGALRPLSLRLLVEAVT